MNISKVSNKLIYFYFFIAPTGLAGLFHSLFPLSFNARVPVGVVSILLIFVLCFWLLKQANWHYSKLDYSMFLLIAIKLFFSWYVVLVYTGIPNDYLEILIKNTLSITVLYLVFFAIYRSVELDNSKISKLVWSMTAGAVTSMIGAYLLFIYFGPMQGSMNLYEIKYNIYQFSEELANVKTGELDIFLNMVKGWMSSVELTIGIGPLLSFLTIFIFSYSVYAKSTLLKIISLLLLIATVLTVSRNALLGLFLGGVFFIYSYFYFSMKDANVFLIKLLSILTLMVVVFGVFVFSSDYGEHFNLDAIESQPRWMLWVNAMFLTLIQPLGYGHDYIALVNEYDVATFPPNIFFSHNHAHNAFLQFGVEAGVVGLGLLLFIIFYSIAVSFNNIKIIKKYFQRSLIPREYLGLSMALFSGFATIFINMCFESSFLTRPGVYTSVIISVLALNMKLNFQLKLLDCNYEKSKIRSPNILG